MSDETKCPKCGAVHVNNWITMNGAEFVCGSSSVHKPPSFHQSDKCRIAELAAKLTAVEAENGRLEGQFLADAAIIKHLNLKLAVAERERDGLRELLKQQSRPIQDHFGDGEPFTRFVKWDDAAIDAALTNN